MSLDQARKAYHSPQQAGVATLARVPEIARQLETIDPRELRQTLRSMFMGAYNSQDVVHHDRNLQRILWLACGDILYHESRSRVSGPAVTR
jgi:hypothetical protein